MSGGSYSTSCHGALPCLQQCIDILELELWWREIQLVEVFAGSPSVTIIAAMMLLLKLSRRALTTNTEPATFFSQTPLLVFHCFNFRSYCRICLGSLDKEYS